MAVIEKPNAARHLVQLMHERSSLRKRWTEQNNKQRPASSDMVPLVDLAVATFNRMKKKPEYASEIDKIKEDLKPILSNVPEKHVEEAFLASIENTIVMYLQLDGSGRVGIPDTEEEMEDFVIRPCVKEMHVRLKRLQRRSDIDAKNALWLASRISDYTGLAMAQGPVDRVRPPRSERASKEQQTASDAVVSEVAVEQTSEALETSYVDRINKKVTREKTPEEIEAANRRLTGKFLPYSIKWAQETSPDRYLQLLAQIDERIKLMRERDPTFNVYLNYTLQLRLMREIESSCSAAPPRTEAPQVS